LRQEVDGDVGMGGILPDGAGVDVGTSDAGSVRAQTATWSLGKRRISTGRRVTWMEISIGRWEIWWGLGREKNGKRQHRFDQRKKPET
jgi:hypothetical protein